MKMTRLRLKFLLPDVEAQQRCVREGWGGAGCPELSSLQASCAGTTIFPRHKERPSEGGREPRGAVCNHSSNLALEPRMWGGGVEGISSPGDPPPPTRPGCQSCRRGRRSRGLSPRSYLGDSEREVVNAAPGVLGIMTLDDG